jgi:hypothetical protein
MIKLRLDITWVVAGRNAVNYLKSLNIDEDWIEIHDNLTTDEFLNLMNSIDIMLLLRLQSNGESSGVAIQAQHRSIPLIISPELIHSFDDEITLLVKGDRFINQNPTIELLSDIYQFIKGLDSASKSRLVLPRPQKMFLDISSLEGENVA